MVCTIVVVAPGGLALRPGLAAGQVGWIEGRVQVDPGPARRWAPRYPGIGARSARLQELMPVAYLRGAALESASAGADTVVIEQRERLFAPSTLVVRAGTTVGFRNSDPYFHNVFSFSPGARFDLGRFPEGEVRSVTLTQPGLVHVACEVHEFMRALILVTRHGRHAVVAPDGSFRIDDVPEGTHRLVVYHPDLGSVEKAVEVRAARGAQVSIDFGATR